jgi:hypothetical protein
MCGYITFLTKLVTALTETHPCCVPSAIALFNSIRTLAMLITFIFWAMFDEPKNVDSLFIILGVTILVVLAIRKSSESWAPKHHEPR